MYISTESSAITHTIDNGFLLLLLLRVAKCSEEVEQDMRQPLSCHPQCRGARSVKLDMITYKGAMLLALQPLNLRCTLHRIKANTKILLRASEVG